MSNDNEPDRTDGRHVVSVDDAPDRVERRSILVDAPPETVFELLAHPARHHDFDGSGTVRDSRDGDDVRLSLGARFGMDMKLVVPYRMTNEVVEFDEGRAIAWRHLGGHIWRYRLEPTDAGTRITEEFDWRPSRAGAFLALMKYDERNARSIEATLERLAELVDGNASP